MPNSMILKFDGPLSWIASDNDTSVFKAKVATECGVYLWTVNTPEGELVYYVGETGRSFRDRMKEHFKEQLSGMYMVYEQESFMRGVKQLVWHGMYARGQEIRAPEYLERLPELLPAVVGFARQMRFFVALLKCETRLRQRIEGAIYDCLKSQQGIAGNFHDYVRHGSRQNGEEPIEVIVQCPSVLRGLPTSLLV